MSENNTMIFTLTFNTDGGGGEFYDVTGEAGSYYQLPSLAPGSPDTALWDGRTVQT